MRQREAGREQEVVHELGELARAQGTEQAYGIAERRQDRQRHFEGGLVATDHDQQAAFGGGGPSSAHRRVDHRRPDGGERVAERDASLGVDRAVDRHDRAGAEAGCDAVGSLDHIRDVVVVDDADGDDVGLVASSAGDAAVRAAVEAKGSSVSARRAQRTVG